MKGSHIIHMIDGLGAGGAERLLCECAPRLTALGWPVSVVVLGVKGNNFRKAELEAAGIPIVMMPVEKLRKVDQVARLARHLRQQRPAIVHTHLEFSSLIAAATKHLHGGVVVSTLHTRETPSLADPGRRRLFLMHHALNRLSDSVICLNEEHKILMRNSVLRQARIDVIPNGIDMTPFRLAGAESRSMVRREFGIGENTPLVVAVAVLRPEKGMNRLVKAFPAVREQHPDAELLIVGDGPEYPALQAQIRDQDASAYIHLPGARMDVARMMVAGDIFVLPTLEDTQPTVIMEAMAAGLPVVGTRVGGIPVLVSQDSTGLLVEPDDVPSLAEAISSLIGRPDQRKAMAAAAREVAEARFSLETQMARLDSLYRELLQNRSARPVPQGGEHPH